MILYQWEPKGLVRRHVGAVSAQDISDSDSSVASDPRFSGIDYLIEDFRRCSNLLTPEDGEGLLAALAPGRLSLPAFVQHAVVTTYPLFQKLGGWLDRLGPDYRNVRRFHFMADARDWLAS